MARRKPYEKIDVNVEPFLSIMAIVLKLISLILVVIVMRIAINPKAKKIVAFQELYAGRGNLEDPKMPSYIDCEPDRVVLWSDHYQSKQDPVNVTWEEMQRPDNAVQALLNEVQKNQKDEYIVVMVRPGCLKFYRAIRNMIAKTPIDVGYDAVDADFRVHWDAAHKALGVEEN